MCRRRGERRGGNILLMETGCLMPGGLAKVKPLAETPSMSITDSVAPPAGGGGLGGGGGESCACEMHASIVKGGFL